MRKYEWMWISLSALILWLVLVVAGESMARGAQRTENPWIDTWPVHRSELSDAAWLLEGACYEPRMLVPENTDVTTGRVLDYRILARRIDGCAVEGDSK